MTRNRCTASQLAVTRSVGAYQHSHQSRRACVFPVPIEDNRTTWRAYSRAASVCPLSAGISQIRLYAQTSVVGSVVIGGIWEDFTPYTCSYRKIQCSVTSGIPVIGAWIIVRL